MTILVIAMMMSMMCVVNAQTRATTEPLTGYTSGGYYSGNMVLNERDLRIWLETSPYISNEEMWTEIDVYYVANDGVCYTVKRSGANFCSFYSTLRVTEARSFYYVDGTDIGDIWLSIPWYL